MDDDGFLVVLCTAPDGEVAARLARGLVEARLAACVNVIGGLRSFYSWKGELHDEPEVQLLVKTRRARFDEVVAWLGAHHPYEVPEILALEVAAGGARYLDWIRAQTSGG
ncbi:MAG: divalent-cation tolerance protein CutA [Sandaracinaceae bacterium]|nr:divalent-cation tolerance protein CutA [Sandaracinaceae bacterium]